MYIAMCVAFPLIGLVTSTLGVACLMPVPRQSDPQPGNGGGPPGPGPEPAPPGGRLADEERVPVLS
jgi:hypothetical protein